MSALRIGPFAALFPRAIHHLDDFMVCRESDGAVVQSESSEGAANRARAVLDDHNERNGHAERYVVRTREFLESQA